MPKNARGDFDIPSARIPELLEAARTRPGRPRLHTRKSVMLRVTPAEAEAVKERRQA